MHGHTTQSRTWRPPEAFVSTCQVPGHSMSSLQPRARQQCRRHRREQESADLCYLIQALNAAIGIQGYDEPRDREEVGVAMRGMRSAQHSKLQAS